MKNSPLISVIVPIYKVEEYLDECVESITRQTYQNLEIILVDDGSPDRCPQMCEEWAKKDPRIKVVHKPNGGLSDARNVGMEIATGDYFSFVDSDDFIGERMYEELLNAFILDCDIAITSSMVMRYVEGKTSAFKQEWMRQEPLIITDFHSMTLREKVSFTVWNKLYRREVMKTVRFRKGKINEDSLFVYDLGWEMKTCGWKMVEIPYQGYFYRYREESITTSQKTPLFVSVVENYEWMMADSKERDKDVYRVIYHAYLNILLRTCNKFLVSNPYLNYYKDEYLCRLRSEPMSEYKKALPARKVFYVFLMKYCFPVRVLIYKVLGK